MSVSEYSRPLGKLVKPFCRYQIMCVSAFSTPIAPTCGIFTNYSHWKRAHNYGRINNFELGQYALIFQNVYFQFQSFVDVCNDGDIVAVVVDVCFTSCLNNDVTSCLFLQ